MTPMTATRINIRITFLSKGGNVGDNVQRTIHGQWLSNRVSSRRRYDDRDVSVGPEAIAITNIMLSIPVANAAFDFADKFESTFLSQMSEIADQVGDGVFVSATTTLLKSSDSLGRPCDVLGFINHALPQPSACTW
jgi:hypothetical protein